MVGKLPGKWKRWQDDILGGFPRAPEGLHSNLEIPTQHYSLG